MTREQIEKAAREYAFENAWYPYDFTIDRINFAKYAVDAADSLIAELKKGDEK